MWSDDAPINVLQARDRSIVVPSALVMATSLGMFGYKIYTIGSAYKQREVNFQSVNIQETIFLAFSAVSIFLSVYSSFVLCIKGLGDEGYINTKHAYLAIIGFSGVIASLLHSDHSQSFDTVR